MFEKKNQNNILIDLIKKAKSSNMRILLPESNESRILEAAIYAIDYNVCRIVLLGEPENYHGVMPKKYIKQMEFLDPNSSILKEKYSKKLFELREKKGMTLDKAINLICNSIYFSMMALKCGDVDGVVAGAITETADVLRPAFQIIKTSKDNDLASSIMIMQTNKTEFGENGVIVFGDCAVNLNPNSQQLSSIAIQSAKTAKQLLDFTQPRVALLSYSTKSKEENVDDGVRKVKDAFLMIRRKHSSLVVDGELQVDSALVPSVAQLKCPYSPVAGRANVLIVPNLDCGNIAYKLCARLAGAFSVGPIIQGLDLPVNDVSRGASSKEIFGVIAVTAIQAKNRKGEEK